MSRKGRNKSADNRREEKATSSAISIGKGSEEALAFTRAAHPSFGPWDWLFASALFVAVFLVYQPAWQGGLLWDDDFHVTRPELRSSHGLYRIWFDVRATLQYYPFLHSAFWIEHKLWGDATLGYHLVKLFLHAVAALMAAILLRRLAIPGAYLAAAVFALHPVQVESVAWIAEQKNTLSAVFYLAAAMAYLRFDRTRRTAWYSAALGLFVLALLSKTVTATLPGALLVVLWWQRGRLSWKQDVLPLLPFFLLGAGMGMITAWWELEFNKCFGPEFEFTPVQRILIAGRAVWFHLGKLFWPAKLTFIYPRWRIDSGVWWQYLYPLGAGALLAVTWGMRCWTRAPLAALLFFGGTLFPVLGLFNLYTFRYSLIADHYQYLACLGIMTLFSAGVALLLKRAEGWQRVLGQTCCVALLSVLAVLSWRQSRMYADAETLYRTTIDGNPDCWLAHTNLANTLVARGQFDEAVAHYRKVLEIKPDDAGAHYNLANALTNRGQVDGAILLPAAERGGDEAIEHFQKAVELDPDYADAHYNLGFALAVRGQFDEAIFHYRKALQIQPQYGKAHYNLANLLAGRGQLDDAIAQYRQALEIQPDSVEVRTNLGNAFAAHGQVDESIAQFRKALEIRPDHVEAHYDLANALAGRGQIDEAIAHYRRALEINPDLVEAHVNLGSALATHGQVAEALVHFQRALALASVRNNKALADVIRAQIKLNQPVVPTRSAP